ncbi:MAG: hypothetical protein LBL45_13715 [Treponema sp.]|nr:hypothetical protein [Treponema sp.]
MASPSSRKRFVTDAGAKRAFMLVRRFAGGNRVFDSPLVFPQDYSL